MTTGHTLHRRESCSLIRTGDDAMVIKLWSIVTRAERFVQHPDEIVPRERAIMSQLEREAISCWRQRYFGDDESASTIAQQLAGRFGDDWRDVDDVALIDACMERGSHYHSEPLGLDRVEFSDGSAIVLDGRCWDVEGDELWSFATEW